MAEYTFENGAFVNPYNFVPISEATERSNDAESEAEKTLHTGCLHCSLTVETPLVIPDALTKTEESIPRSNDRHSVYRTYRIGENVVIPGSSIRGVLRSVYEAATNSCMVTMNPKEHVTKRSDLGTFSPCVLRKSVSGGKMVWELLKAKRIPLVCEGTSGTKIKYSKLNGEGYNKFAVSDENGEKYVDLGNEKLYFGDEVDIGNSFGPGHLKVNKRTQVKTEVWGGKSVKSLGKAYTDTHCYLYLGETIVNKHAESVFKVDTKDNSITDSMIKEALDGLEETLLMYRSENINRNLSSDKPGEKHYGYHGYERAKKNGIIPLWYKYENGHLYLSLAAIGRIAYVNTLGDISNNHAPCTSRKQLCPACAVFGMVGKGDKDKGIGSLIRVTDAISAKHVDTTMNVTLKELGSPRTSYLPFYSERGKGYDDNGAAIRGRKFYWHIPKVNTDRSIYSTNEKTKRNGTFELINRGNCFEFDVYYDSLTEDQLNMLIWSINLPNESGTEKLLHKLGHGKPLGLGSVKLSVIEQRERIYNGQEYSVERTNQVKSEQSSLLHMPSWIKMKKLMTYNPNSDIDIRYPYVIKSAEVIRTIEANQNQGWALKENVVASHKWFSEFKKGSSNVLPEPEGTSLLKECVLTRVKVPDMNAKGNASGDFQRQNGNNTFHHQNQQGRRDNRR